MKSSLIILYLAIFFLGFSQDNKKGTIKVGKSTLEGLYLYESEKGTKTYIKVSGNNGVMIANNNADVDYMEYWFKQMATSSNLPKGILIQQGEQLDIEIKVAQSKEDNIILTGTILADGKLRLRRVGEGYDNDFYIFNKQK